MKNNKPNWILIIGIILMGILLYSNSALFAAVSVDSQGYKLSIYNYGSSCNDFIKNKLKLGFNMDSIKLPVEWKYSSNENRKIYSLEDLYNQRGKLIGCKITYAPVKYYHPKENIRCSSNSDVYWNILNGNFNLPLPLEWKYSSKETRCVQNISDIYNKKGKVIGCEVTYIVGKCPCISNWNCGSWSNCLDNNQNRICNDLNNCGSIINKPEQSRSCIEPTPLTLEETKKKYNNYFEQYPRIKNMLDIILPDDYIDTNNYWDKFYIELQNRENNKTGGTSYNPYGIIAHSIYIDKHDIVPWKLNDYDNSDLNIILHPDHPWDQSLTVYTCNSQNTFDYAKKYIKNNQVKTIYALIDSVGRYRHSMGDLVDQYNGTIGCDDYVLPSNSIWGCHAASELLRDLSININIPAYYHYNSWCDNWFIYGHGSIVWPKIGYIPHGDDIYNQTYVGLKPCQIVIPWDYLNNQVIPLKCRNPNSCDNPCNCLHYPGEALFGCGYYAPAVGFNPAYESYNRSKTICQ